MSRAIITLPMMPVDGNNYGKYVTPIICEAFKNIYDCKYYHCVNLLDSFNNRKIMLEKYLKSLENNGIIYDELWVDEYVKDILIDNVKNLINMGYIKEFTTTIDRCSCGVVEIEDSKIKTCNPNNLKFKYVDDDIYCKICKNKCEKETRKVLAFVPPRIKIEDIVFIPKYLNNDAKTYQNIVLNSYITISRKRDTGIKIEYNGTCYNLDIDFLWQTYLANFPEKQKIVVGGNKMSYQLFLVGLLEKCFNPNPQTILLGTPYIDNIKDITQNQYFKCDNLFRKISVLLSLRSRNKNVRIDDTVLKYLLNLSEEDLKDLYGILCSSNEIKDDFIDNVENIMKNQFNMQKNIKKLKKRKVNKNV